MKTHIVKMGENLSSIAGLYYSNPSEYFKIFNANSFLKGRAGNDIANDFILIVGEKLIIPGVKVAKSKDIKLQDNDLVVEIDGEVFEGFTGVTIDLNLDTIADGFSLVIGYQSLSDYAPILKRFKYQEIVIKYQNIPVLTGNIIIIEISSGENANTITLSGYSTPGILQDVNMSPTEWPRQFLNMSFKQIAEKLCTPLGIDIVISSSASDQANVLYKEVEIGITEMIGSFLNNLAQDRSIILSSTGDGELFFDRIESGRDESFNVKKPSNPVTKNYIKFDGSALYKNAFLVRSGSESKAPKNSTFSFPISDSNRTIVIIQEEDSEQNESKKIENIVKKSLAKAQEYRGSMIGWLNNNNGIVKPGQIFSVVDPSLQILENERHIVRSVKLTSSARGGRQLEFNGVLEAAVVAV